jgi:hypothetical protein
MSRVTSVILTTGAVEQAAIADLNAKFASGAPFVRVRSTDTDVPYAGTKAIECEIYLGGFNHLDETALLTAIRSVRWEYADEVQLFVRRQEETRFTEIPLHLDS